MNVQFKIQKEPQQVVDGIDTLLRECYSSLDRENELAVLSKAIVELPLLMNGLGYYVAEADANVSDAKDQRDHYLDTEVLKYMKAADTSKTEAESTIRSNVYYREKQVKYLEAERVYKRMQKKWQSVDKSFEGMRSRLSIIKQDLKEGA